jgi:hypothetical protein
MVLAGKAGHRLERHLETHSKRATKGQVGTMRILDIDLDFFLNNIAHDNASDGERLSDDEFKPWSEPEVRAFLESRCGLSTDKRIPGKFIVNHHEAFYWWRQLIRSGKLTKPFEVVHVDAHADLGAGTFAFSACYVTYELLHRPPEQREMPEADGTNFNAGNYLLVAVACRWLSKLVYVMHPKNNLQDCEDWLFADDGYLEMISLPKCKKPELAIPGVSAKVLDREPPVEFDLSVPYKFNDQGDFDFIVLCHSSGFTPKSSDTLIPVIMEYMDVEE